jgi:hypothetical protein
VSALDRHVDVEPFPAGRLDERLELEHGERLAKELRRLHDVRELDAGRIQIEQDVVRSVRPLDPRRPDMEVDAAPVDESEQRLDRVHDHVAHGLASP